MGGGEGRAELLRVVPCVVLRDDLLQAKSRGDVKGQVPASCQNLPDRVRAEMSFGSRTLGCGPRLLRSFGPAYSSTMPPGAWGEARGAQLGPETGPIQLASMCEVWIVDGLVHLMPHQWRRRGGSYST